MRHMMEQARFGLSEGLPNALVQSNGDIVRLAPGKPEKIGHAATGRLVIDGDVILPADGGTINERRKLALHGQISVAVAIGGNGQLLGAPQLKLQGVPVEEDRDPFLDEASDAVAKAVRDGGRDREKTREQVRLAVRRVATRWTGKKPIVDVLLIEA
jgi:ribonuclease J